MIKRHERLTGFRRQLIALSALGTLLAGATQAATIVKWDFSGLPTGAEDHLPASSTSFSGDFNISTSFVDRSANAGADVGSHPGSLYAGQWAGYPDQNDYYEFTVSANAGAHYSISKITFDILNGPNQGAPEWWVYSDRNGYLVDKAHLDPFDLFEAIELADVVAAENTHTYPLRAVDPTNPGFSDLTGDITFRLYGFGNEVPAAGVINFDVEGDVSVHASAQGNTGGSVPETFPAWSIGLLFAGLVAARSIQSRQVARARA
jgi:hypothetical protein